MCPDTLGQTDLMLGDRLGGTVETKPGIHYTNILCRRVNLS